MSVLYIKHTVYPVSTRAPSAYYCSQTVGKEKQAAAGDAGGLLQGRRPHCVG